MNGFSEDPIRKLEGRGEDLPFIGSDMIPKSTDARSDLRDMETGIR